MAGPKIADRVYETTTTTGTGTVNLAGAVPSYRTFVAGVGTGDSCYYCIQHQSADEWEVGIGTVTDASPDTLSRTTILASTNGGAAVNFSAGTKNVFVVLPAVMGGQWRRLSSATASASATIEFALPAGYSHYKVVYSHVAPATDGARLWLRTSSDGGSSYDSGGSDYRYAYFVGINSTNVSVASSADTKIILTHDSGNAANETASGEVTICNPSAAQYGTVTALSYYTDTNPLPAVVMAAGQRLSAADVDAVRFLMSSGNISSGTFELWGLAP